MHILVGFLLLPLNPSNDWVVEMKSGEGTAPWMRGKKIQGILVLLGRCSISINHDLPHDLALCTLVLNSTCAEG